MATVRVDLGPHSNSKTVSTADFTRLEAAAKITFNMPDATSAQLAAKIADNFFRRLKQIVKATEANAIRQAADEAIQSITDISLV